MYLIRALLVEAPRVKIDLLQQALKILHKCYEETLFFCAFIKAFDTLVAKYQVLKYDTVGDAYIVLCGSYSRVTICLRAALCVCLSVCACLWVSDFFQYILGGPVAIAEPAREVGNFFLDMRDIIRDLQIDEEDPNKRIQVRFGIHTGY